MRLYRLLLRMFPASFRDEYGSELSGAFDAQRRDATGIRAVGLWAITIPDLLTNAIRVTSPTPLPIVANSGIMPETEPL